MSATVEGYDVPVPWISPNRRTRFAYSWRARSRRSMRELALDGHPVMRVSTEALLLGMGADWLARCAPVEAHT